MDEALLAVVHLLVIGCWLGTDLAVFFLSGRVVDPAQPMSVRRFCANAMSWLDMLPRTALVLTLASGLAMSMSLQFLPDWHAGAELVWLGSAVWLLLVWRMGLMTIEYRANGEVSFILQMPVWWGYAASLLPAVFGCLVYAWRLLESLHLVSPQAGFKTAEGEH